MELTGTWRAAVADDHLRRRAPDPALDDGDWETVPVPGHWRNHPAFAEVQGPVLHRLRFATPGRHGAALAAGVALGDEEISVPLEDDRRWWLTFDGVMYQSDVWLDGNYLGDTEGSHLPHTFEVGHLLGSRAEHTLTVEVACPPERDKRRKRNLLGAYQHSVTLDDRANPGGIWAPVRLTSTGPVRITSLRLVCIGADATRAEVSVRAHLDSDRAGPVTITTRIAGTDLESTHTLAVGMNRLEWRMVVIDPPLWWPHQLGEQPLVDAEVTVRQDGHVTDRRVVRTGLREVRMDRWVMSVNGERLFLKGTNQGPLTPLPGDTDPEDVRRVLTMVRDAGLDLVRLTGHVAVPEVYDTADELGLLIWQDLPLQWGYHRSVRRAAVRLAHALVPHLGHHPSLAVWCGHNEPMPLDLPAVAWSDRGRVRRNVVRAALSTQVPTPNNTVIDGAIRRALSTEDPSRPVIAHSGVPPRLPLLRGTDAHLYPGWYHGSAADLPRLLRAVPSLARFVSEFGAQAVPADAAFCEPERWPDLDWDRLERDHLLQRQVLERHVPVEGHARFEDWQAATQHHQAEVIRRHVETLRRLKYAPTGGFAQFQFADAHPTIGFSVVGPGPERRPTPALDALASACRPVIITADPLPTRLATREAVECRVHLISDLREPIEEATAVVLVRWDGGERRWGFQGGVGADDCALIGTLRFAAPDQPGPLTVDLEVRHPGGVVRNRYAAVVEAVDGGR